MNTKNNMIKLSDKDKKTIVKHSGICTDSHGKGCEAAAANEHNKKLN